MTSSLVCLAVMKGLGTKMIGRRTRKMMMMMSKWKRKRREKMMRMKRGKMISRSRLELREMKLIANILRTRRRRTMNKSNNCFHF